MAAPIVTWGSKQKVISPSFSKTPSMISFDSVLSDNPELPLAVEGATHATESQAKYTSPQAIEPSGSRACTSVSVYPGADAVGGAFIRHHKYFFKDGNVTFLVGNTLYCVHRYFFSRDSVYFSTRFTQLGIRDHEAFPTIISLEDIEDKDFDAFLSILYPKDFEKNHFSYEEWKSVLHLSTRWDFASIRKLALSSIEPPTPHDRLLLARTYSVDNWVVPALSALCEKPTPLTLSEARQMSIEDVVLVSTVREDIRGRTLQVNADEISLRVEAEQLGALGLEIPDHLRFPKSEASSPLCLKWGMKEDGAHKVHENDGEHSFAGRGRSTRNTNVFEGESSQPVKNNQGGVTATRTVETVPETLVTNNIGIQQGDPEKEEDKDIAIGVPLVASGSGSAASTAPPSYPVGRGISLPSGRFLPRCESCDCRALISRTSRCYPSRNGLLCLDHGLDVNSVTEDLVIWKANPQSKAKYAYAFISPDHEAAIREFLA